MTMLTFQIIGLALAVLFFGPLVSHNSRFIR
jgi:hypothetical protein